MTFEELQAKLVVMQEMYDSLLTKYRDEIEKRCNVESGYKTLYQLCIKAWIITQQKEKSSDTTTTSEIIDDNK